VRGDENAVIDDKQASRPLVAALQRYQEEGATPFHMPGHKQGKGTAPALRDLLGERLFWSDLTEVDGLDDLHEPSGAIREAQALAAELYGAEQTFFLVNGVLAGFYAMLAAACRPGEKILAARNLHPAAAEAIRLSRVVPVYWQPEIDPVTLLPRVVTPAVVAEGLRRFPDIRAVLLPGPSAAGFLPDWAALVAVCDAHDAALLTDETAGISFPGEGALPFGAAAAVHDLALVPGVPAQGALLHIGGKRLAPVRVQAALGLIQTTSPSYLIMAGLDQARYWLAQNGPAAKAELPEQTEFLRQEIAAGRKEATVQTIGPGRDPFCLTITFPGRVITELATGLEELRRAARAAVGLNSVVLRLQPENNPDDMARIVGSIRAVKTRALAAAGGFSREIIPEFAGPRLLPLGTPIASVPYRQALMRPVARRTVVVPPDTCVLYPGEIMGAAVVEALAWQERCGVKEGHMVEVYMD